MKKYCIIFLLSCIIILTGYGFSGMAVTKNSPTSQDYLRMQYDMEPDDRLFPVSAGYLHHMMNKGCKAQNLTRIRIHDLRHSHVSLLIDMGYSAVAIADRMGHESIDITYRYAHLFPTVQKDMATRLNGLRENG